MPDAPVEPAAAAPAATIPDYAFVPNVRPTPADGPARDWRHRKLYENVKKTMYALPEEFSSSIELKDFRATDIFTLNSALGASIEDAVVRGLNKLREVWDPANEYALYRFERQSQAFPDVRLVSDDPSIEPVLMGIELKGWFALAKEGEPTFRYQVSADACAPQDLLVVFPWVLSDVVAGTPKLMPPFVGEAKFAAQLRNYYWQHEREAKGDVRIVNAEHRSPYPQSKVDQCSDRAVDDGGNNFGRVSRYGLMQDFLRSTGRQLVSGIPVRAWLGFFKLFSDKKLSMDERLKGLEEAYQVNAGLGLADIDTLIKAQEMYLSALREHRESEIIRLRAETEKQAAAAKKRAESTAKRRKAKQGKAYDEIEGAFGEGEVTDAGLIADAVPKGPVQEK